VVEEEVEVEEEAGTERAAAAAGPSA